VALSLSGMNVSEHKKRVEVAKEEQEDLRETERAKEKSAR
jgi:hypothetical protein